METTAIIAAAAVLVLMFFFIGSPVKLLKFFGQGVIKILIGALFLFFLNAFGNQYGIHIPINLVTAAVSGLLGLPGIGALVVIDKWII